MSSPSDFFSVFNAAGASFARSFEHLVKQYADDPLVAIPPAARRVFEKTANPTIVLLGTKDFGSFIAAGLGDQNRIAYVVDDFKCHRGELFCGAEIISTDKFVELARTDKTLLAINTCRYDFSRRFFKLLCEHNDIAMLNYEQGVRLLGLSERVDYRVADWGPTIAGHYQSYVDLARRMADEQSVDTLFAVLCFHLSCDPEWYLNICRPYLSLYFRSGLFSLSNQEKMVDCGASIGESTTALIDATSGQFLKSWMIEPDKRNVATLEGFLRKFKGTPLTEKIELLPYAVGDENREIPFAHLGGHGGSIVIEAHANGTAPLRRLDDVIDDAPTLIKMDIEGAEIPALRGARRLIGEHRPKLLLSAYHRADDLIRIPEFVGQLRDDYKIGLRHHTEDRWDTCLYFY
jgi:FkbM family methyltransferase